MRGDTEKQCLNAVKEQLNHIYYFGMSAEDCIQFEKLIKTAEENKEPSIFPDFVLEEGFIEHFQVTSSYSNRNGYAYQREYSKFSKKFDKMFLELQDEMTSNPVCGEIKSISESFSCPEHSHENLIKSFKEKWESHILSLEKSQCNKEVGIFLIDYPEMALRRHVEFGVKCELSYGDLLFREKNSWYRLSRDKELLKFMFDYRNTIKYVIFKSFNCIEVFNTAHIREIFKLIPWEYKIYPCTWVKEQSIVVGTSIPNNLIRKVDIDDDTK